MTPDPNDLLTAVVALLRADLDLVAILGGARVWNHAPQDTQPPLVLVRLAGLTDFSDKTSRGYELTLTCDCWTSEPGDQTGQQAAARIVALLDNQPAALAVTPPLLLCQFDGQDATTDPAGLAHVITLRLRILWPGT